MEGTNKKLITLTISRESNSTFRKIRASFVFLVLVCSPIAPQIASATIFQPNETLTPDCAPRGSVNCGLATTTLIGILYGGTRLTFAPSWLAVPQPGYGLIDNKNGQFIKTAGFPKGLSLPKSFGAVTFRAKGAGDTNLFDLSLLPRVETTGAGLVSKVAPGEFLPLSVKLLNFGNRNKVDVTISYKITDLSGKVIYSAEETVAVETTATFVKTIQIPFGTTPGRYSAKSSIIYQDQVTPATTEFPFTVERKILGLFQSNFLLYGGIAILLSVLMIILGRALVKRRYAMRFTPLDYSDISRDKRTFYEILSDTIMQMRERVGDKALLIASDIPGLKIDKETGRVLSLTEHPSKIIATLVSEYEELLGKKVSFSFRPEKADL